MKCSICQDGLFIPLDDYVEAFCTSSHFTACMQYTLYAENHISLLDNFRKSEINHRKNQRIRTSHEISLMNVFHEGRLVSQLTSGTKTIDISKGGMRMATIKPLINDATVQISLDESFPEPLHKITGQVKWCNKQINEAGYQAGISFQDDIIIEAMDRYLGQYQEQM